MVEEAQISKEEWVSWKENKITQLIEGRLKELREDRKEYMANGGTLVKGDSPVTTEFVVGYIQGLNEFLYTNFDEQQEDRDQYDH